MSLNQGRDRILAKCAVVMGVSHVAEKSNFFQLGGDSLQAVEIGEILSVEYGRDAAVELVLRAATFGDLLDELEA